ncbi:MAG: hypothetical protein IKW01_04150, partial [Firmicutes bacterium]|nr:hypothetical protein [Bacillota bacterium]
KLEEIVLVECEPVDVSHIYKDTSIPIKPILPEGIEVAMNSEHLQVKVVAVDAATRIFTFTENDIVLEGVTEGMIPDIEDISVDIKVSGNDEAVASIAESDFSISADVRGLEPGEHIVPLKCICKNNLLELEYNPKEIKVIIEGKKAEENNTEKPPKQESQDSSQQGASKEPGGNVADENLSQNQGEGEI